MNTHKIKQFSLLTCIRSSCLVLCIVTLSLTAMEKENLIHGTQSAPCSPTKKRPSLHIIIPFNPSAVRPRLTAESFAYLTSLVSQQKRTRIVESDMLDIAAKAQQNQLTTIQGMYAQAKTPEKKQSLLDLARKAQEEVEQKETPLFYMVDCIAESDIDKENGEIDISETAKEIMRWATCQHPNRALQRWLAQEKAKFRPQSTPPFSTRED